MSSVVGYLNPTGKISELPDAETVTVTVAGSPPDLGFSALSLGDKLVIDFNNAMSSYEVLPLIWAVNVLAAIDLLSIITGNLAEADIIERVRTDGERVFRWLEALNSPVLEDRVILRQLEYDFWEGERTFPGNIDMLMNEATKGFSA